LKNFHRCYIYVDIKYRNEYYSIITLPDCFYNELNDFEYHGSLTSAQFLNILDSTLFKKGFIEVNDSFYYFNERYILEKDLVRKYDSLSNLGKKYIDSLSRIVNKVGLEDGNAIIYTFLKKGLGNCCQECESGATVILDTLYPISKK